MRLAGKTAIVTGGARGLGAAVAADFVAQGARVMIGDVLDREGRTIADSLGGAAGFMRTDVSKAEQWEALVEATESRFGSVDILVNNAAVIELLSFDDISEAQFRVVFEVNELGCFLGMK